MTTTPDNDRVIPLHGIHNLRDYGGYRGKDGAMVRRGLLWRSSQHVDATAEDLTAIDALGLATVIDLRGDSEREAYPCMRSPAFAARVLFAPGETAGSGHAAPHVEAARAVTTATDAHRAMVTLYESMPFRPNLIAVFRLYFDALATVDGPSLLHCLAGKDRTGLAAGLLHHLLGVGEDDIMADYMLTNVAGNIERRIAAGAATVRANFGHAMEDGAVRTLMSVHPEFLETGLTAIRREHGSVDAYLRDVMGVDAEARAAIEGRFLG